MSAIPLEQKQPHALSYAARGWHVFPINSIAKGHCTCGDPQCKRPGKHPLGKLVQNGLNDATTERATIIRWWKQYPWANIGIRTGVESGIIVLDIDTGDKGGDESLYSLISQHGEMPDTVEQITGSGGRHIFFRHPGEGTRIKNSVSTLGPGLDIRGDGGYIVAPPSLHISGRQYEWEASSTPDAVGIADAPAWLIEEIKAGPREDHVGEGSQGSLSPEKVAEIRQALVYIDSDNRDIWLYVGMALHSTGAGSQAYGLWCEWSQQSDRYESAGQARTWKSFKASGIGLGTLFQYAKDGGWLPPKRDDEPPEEDDFIDALNKRHAVVSIGGQVRILNIDYDHRSNRRLLSFSAKQDFILRYANQRALVNKKWLNIGKVWLEDQRRRQYSRVDFDPSGQEDNDRFNLFCGWSVQPRKGVCGRFQDFILDVICSADDAIYDYVIRWLAHLFQKPAELPGTALVLRGKQGVGKNKFTDTIGSLCSAHYVPLTSITQVAGRFSGHLADALLVYANEAIWGGDKTAEGVLKAMITDPFSPIERKGKDLEVLPNFKRLIAASNEDWPIPRGLDDRRYLVLDVSNAHQQDGEYFRVIDKEMANGGLEALLDWLLSIDLDGWHPRQLPEQAKKNGWDIKIRSAPSHVQWWMACLSRGYVCLGENGVDYGWPTDPVAKSYVYSDYIQWCGMHRVFHPAHEMLLGKYLREHKVHTIRPRHDNRVRCYAFPPIETLRESFTDATGIPFEEEADDG